MVHQEGLIDRRKGNFFAAGQRTQRDPCTSKGKHQDPVVGELVDDFLA